VVHDLSHHGCDPKKIEKLRKIIRFHIEHFAYLLGKLKAMREGEHVPSGLDRSGGLAGDQDRQVAVVVAIAVADAAAVDQGRVVEHSVTAREDRRGWRDETSRSRLS
jgi:hypothetical protein